MDTPSWNGWDTMESVSARMIPWRPCEGNVETSSKAALFYRLGTIAVGRPVTRPPPHRSRRAVFSHRALQTYSLPHVGLSHQDCLLWPWPPNNPWAFDLEVLEYFCVAVPVVATSLATPTEPLHQHAD